MNSGSPQKIIFSPEELAEIVRLQQELFPGRRETLLASARSVAAGCIPVFETFVRSRGDRIDWTRDPLTGGRWILWRRRPRLLSWRGPRDIKYVWELNRQQYLFELAKAAVCGGETEFSPVIREHIRQWIRYNRQGLTVNWLSPLENVLRVYAWLWSLHCAGLTRTVDCSDILESVREQLRYVEANLQHRTYPNNHLIGEAAGLVIGGILLPEAPESLHWRTNGIRILEEQIDRQVFGDGMDQEQALDYHRFVLDFYTHVTVLCRKNQIPVPSGMLQRLEKMYEALMWSMRPDGRSPFFGDDDGGRVARLSTADGRDIRSALAVGAALFSRADMKYLSGDFSEEALWLLGAAGWDGYRRLPAVEPAGASHIFAEAGLVVMRSGWNAEADYLAIDCGPQGMGDAGHGHSDALSFELCLQGRPLLVDAGTYRYNGEPGWRDFFRGTAAHNTVRIDGADQSVPLIPHDAFGWRRKADASIRAAVLLPEFDFVWGLHAGYQTAGGGSIRHERVVLWVKPDYWLITDIITGSGTHTVEWFYHFADSAPSLAPGSAAFGTQDIPPGPVAVIPWPARSLQAESLQGCLRPIQGWISERYGEKKSAPVGCWRRTAELPLLQITCLWNTAVAGPPPVLDGTLLSGDPGAVALTITQGPQRDFFFLNPDRLPPEEQRYGGSVEMGWVRESASGRPDRLFLYNVSTLERTGSTVLALDRKTEFVSASLRADQPSVVMTGQAHVTMPSASEPALIRRVESAGIA